MLAGNKVRQVSTDFQIISQWFASIIKDVSLSQSSLVVVLILSLGVCAKASADDAVLPGPDVVANELVTISQPDGDTWTGLGFVDSFNEAPVVIPSVLSSNDADPAEVMLSGVTASGVDVRSGEWEYQDGAHGDESIGLLLLEPGAHDLGGLNAQAGKATVSGSFSRVDFAAGFSSVPVVLAQLVSEKGDVTATVRLRSVDANGFSVQLQTEEALGTVGDVRELHYVAIEQGAGSYNGQRLLAGKTGRAVRHTVYEMEFGEELLSPLFYAQDQQRYGGDTSWVRLSALHGDRAEIWIQEEQSKNDETRHTTEDVGWVVVGDAIVVEPPPPPQLHNDGVTITQGSTTTIDVLGNDIDIEGLFDINGMLLPNSFEIVDLPSHGTVSVQPDGIVVYENDGLSLFVDSFTYRVNEEAGGPSNIATVTVDVLPNPDMPLPNADPMAVNDSGTVAEGQEIIIAILDNDSDPENEALTPILTSQPENGTVALTENNEFSYAHDGSETTVDSIGYQVSDESGGTASAVVNLVITPVNDEPVAVDDSATVQAGGEVTIAVLGNDSDAENDPLTLSIVAEPALGTLDQNTEDNTLTYSHTVDETGVDSFTYRITDSSGAEDTATVAVLVEAAPVVANADTATVASDNESREVQINVLANDTGITDQIVELIEESAASLGTAVVVDNVITYTVAETSVGTDTFAYRVQNEAGSAEATVTVTIEARPITLVDDVFAISADADSVVLDLFANDGGPIDFETLEYETPELGTIETDPDTGELIYNAADGASGEDTFTYSVRDVTGSLEGEATVTVAVEATPSIVVANNDAVQIDADQPGRSIDIDVLANDEGIGETAAVVLQIVANPSMGSVSLAGNLVTYTFNHGVLGTDTFSYSITDAAGSYLEEATVTVNILPGSMIHSHHEMVPNPVHGSAFSVSPDCKDAASPCNWDQSSTWLSGTIPDSQSLVIVDGDVQIRFQGATAKSIGIYPGGTLSFATDSNTRLEVADILIVKGGALEIGSSESPIAGDRLAELVFRDLAFDAFDSGQHLRGLVAMGGSVKIHGRTLADTFIRSTEGLSANSVQVNLADSASAAGWQVGDSVVIPRSRQCRVASEDCNDETEDRTISAISADGRVLTLSDGLSFGHPGAYDHAGNLDFSPHIINKSRNIVIRSENPQGTRGHLLFHGRADVDIRYAEIRDLGRTNIDDLGPNNQKGRYPLHAHHLIGATSPQANGYQFTLVGNTVDFGDANRTQNRKWGISIHGSHYGLIEQNIVDHASGAAIVTESGEEIGNMFSENFVVRVIGGNGVRTSDPDPGDNSKLGRSGSAYWFNGGGRNFFENNVAAAIAECVYCYGFKFDNVRNGQLLFPIQQGDMPHLEGESIAAEAVGLNNFIDNEAYAVPNGLTVWWECTFSDYPNESCSSQIDGFKLWHHHRWGYHGYPENNMTLNDFVVRGDPSVLENQFETVVGLDFGDYMTRNLLIKNADIQNVRTGINMPTMRDMRGVSGPDIGFSTVEDSYLVASLGIVVWAPASVNGSSDLSPQTSVIRNVQFDYPDGHITREPPSHIYMADTSIILDPNKTNYTLRNDVQVYNYNSAPGIEGDNFYIVPGYQGIASCDDSLGQCDSEITSAYSEINLGHVYPLAEEGGTAPEPPANLAPVAANDSLFVGFGQLGSVHVLINDADADGIIDTTTVTIVDSPAYGTANVLANGSINYEHDESENLSDSFTYTVMDDSGELSNTASVEVTIEPNLDDPPGGTDDPPAENALPVAEHDEATVDSAVPSLISVLQNDSDTDGALDVTSIVVVTGPENGTAEPQADGSILYTHDLSAIAGDSFEYTVADNLGAISNPALVTITVELPDDPAPEIGGPENLVAFHRSGQTFLTWQESDAQHEYHVYRYTQPVTVDNLAQAERLTDRWGPLPNDTSVNRFGGSNVPSHYVIEDLGDPLSDETGLFVHTAQEDDSSSFYAITSVIEGVENVSTLHALDVAVEETVQEPEDVLTVSVNGGSGRIYTQFMDYANWNATFNGYIYNYSVALPAGYDQNQSYPLMINPHASYQEYGFLQETLYGWQVITLLPSDPGPVAGTHHSWWYGYAKDHNYLTEGSIPQSGAIENFTEQRVMRSIKYLTEDSDINVDAQRIHAQGLTMGGSGALAWSMRYPNVISGVWVSEPMTNYSSSPQLQSDFQRLWGTQESNLPILNRGPYSEDIQVYGIDGMQPVGVWDWMNHQQQLVERRGDNFGYIMTSHAKNAVTFIDWQTQGKPLVQSLTESNVGFTSFHRSDETQANTSFDSVITPLFGFGNGNDFPWKYPLALAFPAIQNASGSDALIPADGGDQVYNLDIEWATPQTPFDATIVDTPDLFEVTLRSTGSTQTADITPRRTQAFSASPGQECSWTTTDQNLDTSIDSGVVTADDDSLITITDVSIVTGVGTRLAIDCS